MKSLCYLLLTILAGTVGNPLLAQQLDPPRKDSQAIQEVQDEVP